MRQELAEHLPSSDQLSTTLAMYEAIMKDYQQFTAAIENGSLALEDGAGAMQDAADSAVAADVSDGAAGNGTAAAAANSAK